MPVDPEPIPDDTSDYSGSIVPESERGDYAWWDFAGDRNTRYASPGEATAEARVAGINGFCVIIGWDDGTYSLSVQYEKFY